MNNHESNDMLEAIGYDADDKEIFYEKVKELTAWMVKNKPDSRSKIIVKVAGMSYDPLEAAALMSIASHDEYKKLVSMRIMGLEELPDVVKDRLYEMLKKQFGA